MSHPDRDDAEYEKVARKWLDAWRRDWTHLWRDQLAPDLASLLREREAGLRSEADRAHGDRIDERARANAAAASAYANHERADALAAQVAALEGRIKELEAELAAKR